MASALPRHLPFFCAIAINHPMNTPSDHNPQTPFETPAWRDAEPHRRLIREMLVQLAGDRQPTLCVWGAGPCNDLDLETLQKYFRHITLVDLDSDTLLGALRARGLEQSPQVTALGGVDLAGMPRSMDGQIDDDKLSQLKRTAAQHDPELPGPFDVVVSTCLLSQLINELVKKLADQPRQMIETLQIIRRRHLELLLQNTCPGGSAILVTDVTSSDALPELLDPTVYLDQLMQTTICQGNHFHGLNPVSIHQALQQEPTIAKQVSAVRVSRPWRWNATVRTYCCLAFLMSKR